MIPEKYPLDKLPSEFILSSTSILNSTNESTTNLNPSLSEVAMEILRKAPGENASWEKDLGSQLDNWSNSTIEILDPSNPFFGEDVLVFNDSYQGLLPNNGMYKSEWEMASKWITSLQQDGVVGPVTLKGDEEFKTEVIKSVKELCQTIGSRKFLKEIFSADYPLVIKSTRSKPPHCLPKKKLCTIALNPNILDANEVLNKGKAAWSLSSFTTTLCHECVHYYNALVNREDFKKRVMDDFVLTDLAHFSNSEELLTITGQTKDETLHDSLLTPASLDDEEDWEMDSEALIEPSYSENWLRTATGQWPRVSHQGFEYIQTPDWSKVSPEKALNAIKGIIVLGDEKKLDEILNSGWREHVGLEEAEKALQEGASLALKHGQNHLYEKLISLGVTPKNEHFLIALSKPDPQPILSFLMQFDKITIKGPTARPAFPNLLFAALKMHCDVKTMQFLISQGIDPLQRNEKEPPIFISFLNISLKGNSLLDEALADKTTLEMVLFLEKCGLQPNKHALHDAAVRCPSEVIEYLITKCGFDPNESIDGQTPLTRMGGDGIWSPLDLQRIQHLISLGADPRLAIDKHGHTLVHKAINHKFNFGALEYLIEECHLDPNQPNNHGRTPLMALNSHALRDLGYAKLQKFKELGFHLTKPIDSDGQTLLHRAAQADLPELIEVLFRNFNFDLGIKDGKGKTAMDYCRKGSSSYAILDKLLTEKSFWRRFVRRIWSP